jgi:hypothetical protein
MAIQLVELTVKEKDFELVAYLETSMVKEQVEVKDNFSVDLKVFLKADEREILMEFGLADRLVECLDELMVLKKVEKTVLTLVDKKEL